MIRHSEQTVQVHHRLFTCETLKDTSPTGILSQSDIVKLMWYHKVELAPLLSKTVEDLGLCAVCSSPFLLHHQTCLLCIAAAWLRIFEPPELLVS